MRKGNKLVPSRLRLYVTGIQNVTAAIISIRIGSVVINGTTSIVSDSILVDPGVNTVDFLLPPTLLGAGDQPIILTVTINGVTFESRLDDTSTRLFIV